MGGETKSALDQEELPPGLGAPLDLLGKNARMKNLDAAIHLRALGYRDQVDADAYSDEAVRYIPIGPKLTHYAAALRAGRASEPGHAERRGGAELGRVARGHAQPVVPCPKHPREARWTGPGCDERDHTHSQGERTVPSSSRTIRRIGRRSGNGFEGCKSRSQPRSLLTLATVANSCHATSDHSSDDGTRSPTRAGEQSGETLRLDTRDVGLTQRLQLVVDCWYYRAVLCRSLAQRQGLRNVQCSLCRRVRARLVPLIIIPAAPFPPPRSERHQTSSHRGHLLRQHMHRNQNSRVRFRPRLACRPVLLTHRAVFYVIDEQAPKLIKVKTDTYVFGGQPPVVPLLSILKRIEMTLGRPLHGSSPLRPLTALLHRYGR